MYQPPARALPELKVLHSSPYDRVMRKFHNYMKDTPSFQQAEQDYVEFRFPRGWYTPTW
ncbi:MAG: hypothetical protein GY935_02740 [Gammaproteobacteria bacterium]|nr:hypothetical protein [Gammaproteobacteria bacterium]